MSGQASTKTVLLAGILVLASSLHAGSQIGEAPRYDGMASPRIPVPSAPAPAADHEATEEAAITAGGAEDDEIDIRDKAIAAFAGAILLSIQGVPGQ